MSLADCIKKIPGLSKKDIAFLENELADGKTDEDAITGLEEYLTAQGEELVNRIEGDGMVVQREGDAEAMKMKSILNQEAEDKKWSKWRPGETSTGKINGAPEWVNNSKDPKKALAKMERELNNRLKEGLAGRMWYEESTRRVLDITNGNLVEAEMLIQLIAIYSPQANVQVNTGFAVKAWNQYKRNEPITASNNTVKDGKATAVLYEKKPFKGRKTSSFYQNLMYEMLVKNPKAMEVLSLDQELIDSLDKPATIDMWMARAFGYNSDALGDDKGSGKYSFSENYLRRITARMNKRLEPGQPRWTPHQVQAAIWTSMKARYELPITKLATNRESTRRGLSQKKGAGYERVDSTIATQQKHLKIWRKWAMKVTGVDATEMANTTAASFETFLDQMTMQIAWETLPSAATGVNLRGLPDSVLRQFHREALQIITGEDGHDQLAEMVGSPLNYVRGSVRASGETANPAYLSHLVPTKSGGFSLEEARAYAQAIQYIYMQSRVPFFRADPRALDSKAAKEEQLFRVIKTSTGRTVAKGKFDTQIDAETFAREKGEGFEVRGGKYAFAQTFRFSEEISPQGREHVLKSLKSVLGLEADYTMTAPNEVTVINFRDPETGLPKTTDQEFDLATDLFADMMGSGLVETLDFWSEGEYGQEQDFTADPEGKASLKADGLKGRSDLQAWIRDRRQEYAALLESYSGEAAAQREVEARQSDYLAQQTAYHGTGAQTLEGGRLSTKYIGSESGTGRTAQGWGLYFSSKEAVAASFHGEAGTVYQVSLMPEEDEYLNWDAPVERQPENIQRIITQVTDRSIEYWAGIGFTGQNVYEMLARNLPGGPKEASITLNKLGIKGNKFVDPNTPGWDATTNYVIFDDTNVEIIDHLSQSAVWYSALQRAAKGLQQKRGSGKQMLAMLKKMPGVKAEEMEWLGLDDYLEGSDSVTREEIQQFIDRGGVEVNDVTYGGSKAEALHPLRQDYAMATLRAIEVVTALDYLGKDTHEEALQEVVSNDRWQAYNNITDTDSIVALKRFREMHQEIKAAKTRSQVQYRQYTLPGGADYREMVLTLPDQQRSGPAGVLGSPTTHTVEEAASRLGMGVEDFQGAAAVLIYDRSMNYIQQMEDGDYWTIMGRDEFTSSNLAEVESWLADAVASEIGESDGVNFRSSHWQEPNVIAHIRFNTREIDGKNTLFIEEIQSDWHQQGRKRRAAEVERVAAEQGISAELANNMVPQNFGYQESAGKREKRRSELKAKMDALDDQMEAIYGPALIERRNERQGSVEWIEEIDDAGFPRLTAEMDGNSITVEFWPDAQGNHQYRGLLEGTEYVYEPTMEEAQASMDQFMAEQGHGEVVRDPDIWTQLRDESGPVIEKLNVDEMVELKMLMEDRDSVFIEFERTDAARNDLPDGPFKKTWPLLSMKRMIRYAVDNGFDQVAWTTGEQQAQRYSQRDERAEGMAGFYDKMLPNQTSKYIKKMGGEVHMVPMQRVEPEVTQAIQEFATFAPTNRTSIEVPQTDRERVEHFVLDEGETLEWDHAYVEPYFAHGDLVIELKEETENTDPGWYVFDPDNAGDQEAGEFEWVDGPFDTEEAAQASLENFFTNPESTGNYNTIVPMFREVNGQVEVQELGMIYYDGSFGDSYTHMTWRSIGLTPYGQNPDFRGPTAEDAMIEDAMPTVGEQNAINVAIDNLLDSAGVTEGEEFALNVAHNAISDALGDTEGMLIQENELYDLMDQFDQSGMPRGNGIDAAEERDNAIMFFTDAITDTIVRRRRHALETAGDFVPTLVDDPRVNQMTDAELRSMLAWNDSDGEFDGATRAEMSEIYHSWEMEDPEGTQSLYDLYVERTGFQPAAAQLPAPQFAPMRLGYTGNLPMTSQEGELVRDGLMDAAEEEGYSLADLLEEGEFDFAYDDINNQFTFREMPLWMFEYLDDLRRDVVPGTEFQNLIEPVAEGQELLPAPQGDTRVHRGEIERGVFPQEELEERLEDMLFNIDIGMDAAGLDPQDYDYGRITNDDEGDYFEFMDVPTQVLSIIANAADDAGLNAALRVEIAPVVLAGGAAQAQLPAPVDQPVELLGAEVSDAVEEYADGGISLDEFGENIGIETNPRIAAWHTALDDIAGFNMTADPETDDVLVQSATQQILDMAAAGGPPRIEIPTATADTMVRNAQRAITLEEGDNDQISAHNELLMLGEDVLGIDWDYHAFYTQEMTIPEAVRYSILIMNQYATVPLPIPTTTPAIAAQPAVLTQAINPEFAINWPFTITGLTDWYGGWLESQGLPPTSADELQGLTQPQRLIVDEFITRWEQAQSREDESNIPARLLEMIQAERGHDHIYFWDNAHINPVVDDTFVLRVPVESDIEGEWMGGTLHVNFNMSQPPADRQQPAEIAAAIENPDNEITINDLSVGNWMTDQDQQTVWGGNLQPIAPPAPGIPALPRPAPPSPMVHAFDITDEMRTTAMEGQALFQDKDDQQERGRFYPNVDGRRVIQLTEASDLSSFLHEGAHLYLDIQRIWAEKYGMNDNQKAMLKWLGARDFNSISIDQHETWAETFEVYLREGKAPSIGLRRAFSSFASWLKRIYTTLRDPRLTRASLDPEITEIFDRLLATQEEIDMAALRPEYAELFQSKEQAGMTDEQWAKYQKTAGKKKETAEMTLDEKVIKQYKAMKSREWAAEKAPIAKQEAERLAQEPIYKLLNEAQEIRDDKGRVIHDGRVDWHKMQKAIGGLPSGKLKSVGGGVDPGIYAEKYGFASVKEMDEQIRAVPNLKNAADEAAEQIMVAKHGDILKDGSLETEVREAMLNEDQAAQVIMELKAEGSANAQKIDRATLKHQAAELLGTMTYKEIRPTKFYNAMIKAAKAAAQAKDPTQDKIQQLANHYLYRAAVDAKAQMDKDRKKVRGVQARQYNPLQVDQQYIEAMKSLANAYDIRLSPQERAEYGRRVLDFYEGQTNPENENAELFGLEMLDPNLVAAIRHRHENGNLEGFMMKTFDEMTVEEMGGVTDMLEHLRYVGGQVANKGNLEAAAIREAGLKSIEENGGKDYGVQRGKQRRGKMAKLTWGDFWSSMSSLGNMVRKLDGFEDGGWAFDNIMRPIQDAIDHKFGLQLEMFKQMEDFMKKMPDAGLRKDDAETITKENGQQDDFSSEEIFMMAVYWGTDSSREALMQGHELSEVDVNTLFQKLTRPQLELVNQIWAMNESQWPKLQEAAKEMLGVAPPKLAAAPFVVNGVEMTGGHMQLMYDSQALELADESMRGMNTANVVPMRQGSTHARKGSGGRPILLDTQNITQSMEEKTHYIAFAEAGRKLRGILNNKDIQNTIEKKHGAPFYENLVHSVTAVSRAEPARETSRWLARLSRWTRQSATLMHLGYSLRNVMQQFPAALISAREVGPIKFAQATGLFGSNPMKMKREIDAKSAKMRDRANLINRDSREAMKKILATTKAEKWWHQAKSAAFVLQTAVDMSVAYPTWYAKYTDSMEKHGDEKRAIIEADQTVAETVGSGHDVYLGRIMQGNQNEFVKTLTIFGSWFNAYYQRLYKASEGGQNFLSGAFLLDAVVMPIIVANLTQMVIGDWPDEDEEWEDYVLKNSLKFMVATLPVVREAATFQEGFTPTTPISAIPAAAVRIPKEIESYLEGRQGGLKLAADIGRTVGTVMPLPGSGNLWRLFEYTESYMQGEEGKIFNPYLALTEGADKDK